MKSRGGEASGDPTFGQLVFIGALSGALAGVVTDFAMFPIEKLKTRLQTSGLCGFLASPFETLRDLFDNVWMVCYCSPIYYGMYFGTYEPLKRFLLSKDIFGEHQKSKSALLASLGATWIMFLTRVPCEVIKIRIMTASDPNPLVAIKRLYSKSGIVGFYTGYASLATVEYPFNLLEITLYEYLSRLWVRYAQHQPTALNTVFIAALADSISGFLTNPFDVIKVRVMNNAGEETNTPYGAGLYGEMLNLISKDGVLGFFAGAKVRTVWMTIGGIVYWLVLEESQKVLRKLMRLRPKVA